MIVCANCKATLSYHDLQRGICPQCRTAITGTGAPADSDQPDLSKRTVTLGQPPVGGESDTAEFEPVQLPLEDDQPQNNQTVEIDESKMPLAAQGPTDSVSLEAKKTVGENRLTVDDAATSDQSADDREELADESGTVEFSPISRTVEADSVDFGDLTPSAPAGGQTIELNEDLAEGAIEAPGKKTVDAGGNTSQTVDADSADFEVAAEAGSSAGGATIDLDHLAEEISSEGDAGPGTGKQTIDIGKLSQTVDSDSVEFGDLPKPADAAPSAGGATIDLDHFDDEILAEGEKGPGAGKQTIDIGKLSQTVDSDSVEFGDVVVPPSAGGATIDLDHLDQLEDEPGEPGAGQGKQTVELGRLSQTVDSDSVEFGDLPAPPRAGGATIDMDHLPKEPDEPAGQAPGRKTVEITRPSQTIDSDSVEAGTFPVAPDAVAKSVGDERIDRTVDSVDLPPPASSRATVDLSRLNQTLDSDSVEIGPVPQPPAGSNATIDTGKIAQTIDSVDLPVAKSSDGNATVDISKLAQTLDSDSVELPGIWPSPVPESTVDSGRNSPTMFSVDLGPPRSPTSDSSIADGNVAQTLDSVDRLPTEGKPGKGTVHDREVAATIDSVALEAMGSSAAGLADLAASDSVSEGRGSGTVNDGMQGQTIDGDVVEDPDKPGTVPDRSVQVTMDSHDFPSASGQAPGTVPDRDHQVTYDSQDVSSREAKQVDQMWRGANVEKASPRMTIKGRDKEDEPTTKTSLVIQRRQFRELKGAEPIGISDADYDLIKVLGQGGMGVVYSARQASIDRTVALKMLKPEMAKDEGQRTKFLAEAVITGDLDHPNIVPIYDLGKNVQGALFYAMKRVQGTPWDRVIAKKTLSENLDILLKVADAVAFAHSRNVVHRDLKPENIMLGEFGEVLVMDWGLALPFGKFEKSRSIQPSVSMGGTPAYMAPEMATGPFDRIGPTSDVYLLGAMLYEVVTGKPPHTGKDVMKCLFAAAKNEIQQTEKTGELIDIAFKAMATKQKDRYPSVQEFQAAIREYEAHSASIAMASRAEDALAEAKKTGNYDTFSRAMFESQEAVTLWSGNKKARRGVSRAKLAYAMCALEKGDLDLAESLLDMEDPSHSDAVTLVAEAKRDREAKQQRLLANRRLIRNLVAAFVIAVTAGLIAVSYQTLQVSKQYRIAQANEAEAKKQAKIASDNEVEAKKQESIAKDNAEEAEKQAKIAKDNADEAKKQEGIAKDNALIATANAEKAKANEIKAKVNAEEAKKQAEIAKANADEAQRQERIAKEEAYVALIGLAAAKIEENAFGYARSLLDQCEPEQRNWEWGRLMYLCRQGLNTVDTGAPVDAVAFSKSGDRFVAGGWNGLAQVFNAADGSVVSSVTHAGSNVFSVAYSPITNEFATGSNDPAGNLQIFNADTGELVRKLAGHTDGVLSVSYSHDGTKLLSASFDNTAKMWDVQTGQLLKEFKRHTWWVWSAAFSPDDQRIVTASQDGTALVWSVDSDKPLPPFMGHQGPVYAAAFSPDGNKVVTGGYDKRVLVWDPADLQEFDYQSLVNGGKVEPPKHQAFDGHLGAVRSVAFSHDGKLLLSGGHDNAVKVWSTESGLLVKTLRGHDSWVRSCAFSPDGTRALSGSHDRFARLWDVSGYEEARVLQGKWLRGHQDAVMAVAFAPAGDRVVTASRDRTARIWDTKSGDVIREFDEGHFFLASTAVYYPNAKRLATAAGDNTTRVWDVASGTELWHLEGTGRASAIAVSHNGRWLLTGGDKQGDSGKRADTIWSAQLWDAENGQRIFELLDHNSQVTAVAFSPDDQYCFTGDSKGRGILWRCETGELVTRLAWHSSKIAAAVFLDDGSRLIVASDDKTVSQWDTSRLSEDPSTVAPLKDLSLKHDDSVISLDVVSARRLAITCTISGTAQLWDLDRAQEIRSLLSGNLSLNAVALSRDGQRALTIHTDNIKAEKMGEKTNCVRLWDVATGNEIYRPGSDASEQAPFLELQPFGSSVWSAIFAPEADRLLTVGDNEARLWDMRAESDAQRKGMRFSPNEAVVAIGYSPDGKHLVTGSRDGSARIWEIETGRDIHKLVGHEGNVNSASYSPDGQWILTTGDDMTARLWNAATGELVGEPFLGHTSRVEFGAFAPDGKSILTTSEDKTARIWDLETRQTIHELKGHEWGVLCAAFSPDGSRVVTGGDDNTARVWDAKTGQMVVKPGETMATMELTGHTAPVTSVAYSPDGKRILTASKDFTAKLWDAEEGKEILNLKGHTQELTAVAFSHDGRQALTGSQDGTAVIWLTEDWRQPVAQTAHNAHRLSSNQPK